MEVEKKEFALFQQLSYDPIYLIFSFGSFKDLCIYSKVSTEWYLNITLNNTLWSMLCQCYWVNKYVPLQYRMLLTSINKTKNKKDDNNNNFVTKTSECNAKKAFRLAYLDRLRDTLTADELTTFKWYFRFKPGAGQSWLQIDPFWNLNLTDNESSASENENNNDNDNDNDDIKELTKGGILTDDEIKEFELKQQKYEELMKEKKKEKVLSEHEKRLLRCTRIRFNIDGVMEYYGNDILKNMLNTQDFKWRFDGTFYKDKLFGNAIQYHSYPKKYICRDINNWGFIMQSNWVIYTSFPFPEFYSDEDVSINNDDLDNLAFQEMIQYNYMDGIMPTSFFKQCDNQKETKQLYDENGMIDLEYLKQMQANHSNNNKKNEKRNVDGYEGVTLEWIVRRLLGESNE
eukprot:230948_1